MHVIFQNEFRNEFEEHLAPCEGTFCENEVEIITLEQNFSTKSLKVPGVQIVRQEFRLDAGSRVNGVFFICHLDLKIPIREL